jgi:hypothetical protein
VEPLNSQAAPSTLWKYHSGSVLFPVAEKIPQSWLAPTSRRVEGVKESKQLIRRPTDEGAKKREAEILGFLCELCVLCGFA